MEERAWSRFWKACSGTLTERDRRNQRKLIPWGLAWMVAWVGVTLLVRDRLLPPGVATWAAVAGTTLLGAGTVYVYVRFLRQAEELQRKIQLDALAVGFGVGLVASVTLEMIQDVGDAQIDPSTVLMFMVPAYTLGVWLGSRRYQ